MLEWLAGNGLRPLRFLGRGTWSDVWLIETSEGGSRALKVIRPEYRNEAKIREQFRNEWTVISSVASPYVVRAYGLSIDWGSGEFPNLLLEHCEGRSLEEVLSNQAKIESWRAIWLIRQMVQGVVDLAEAGFSHGDLKPANAIVDERGCLKLIDLANGRRWSEDALYLRPEPDRILSGTLEYLAPESLSREPSSALARDIYSLGVIFFRMLTGVFPFPGVSSLEILQQQRSHRAPSVRTISPEIPIKLATLVQSMLQKQPLRRPQHPRDVLEQLIHFELETMEAAA